MATKHNRTYFGDQDKSNKKQKKPHSEPTFQSRPLVTQQSLATSPDSERKMTEKETTSSSEEPMYYLRDLLEQLSLAAESTGVQDIAQHSNALHESLFSSSNPSPVLRALNSKLPESVPSAIVAAHPSSHPVLTLRSLPALPPILDPALEKAVFTHPSGQHSENTITASEDPAKSTYERLEFLGDAYIEIISTRLVYSRFPTTPVGKQSQIREKLIRNEALAEHSQAYSFDKRVQATAQERNVSKQRTWTKILADVFEAYVAAVILSDSQNGFAVAERWLTELWAPYLLTKIESPTVNANAKSELARMIMSPKIKIDYNEEVQPRLDRKNGLYHFTIGCYLTGWGYERKRLGVGEGRSKSEAGNMAAAKAMETSKDVLQDAHAQKLEYDRKRKEEREAEAKRAEQE